RPANLPQAVRPPIQVAYPGKLSGVMRAMGTSVPLQSLARPKTFVGPPSTRLGGTILVALVYGCCI
ncbi:MAG TPA: hypothetical protein VJU54_02550, partial [Nitrospiraceae bacterium]|nr:hypothetical protein [Nitrospiraceae bacterium]